MEELQAMTAGDVRHWLQFGLNISERWAADLQSECIDGAVLSTYDKSKFKSDFPNMPLGYRRKILDACSELLQKAKTLSQVLTHSDQTVNVTENMQQTQELSQKAKNKLETPSQVLTKHERTENIETMQQTQEPKKSKQEQLLRTTEAAFSNLHLKEEVAESTSTRTHNVESGNMKPQPAHTPLTKEDAERKLRFLLTGDESGSLDESFYPVLVTNKPKPEYGERDELKKKFEFVALIKWNAVFDCYSKSHEFGLCSMVQNEQDIKLLLPDEFRPNRSSEEMEFTYKPAWIFANGRKDIEAHDAPSRKSGWNKMYGADVDHAIDFFLSTNIPENRATVIFTILSNENLKIMTEIFRKMDAVMQGKGKFAFLVEDKQLYEEWVDILHCQRDLLDKEDVDEISLVGLKWEDINNLFRNMSDRYIEEVMFPVSNGPPCPVTRNQVSRWQQNIEVLSATQCEMEFKDVNNAKLRKLSEKKESHFYAGNGVGWENFYLTDRDRYREFDHVHRRDCCKELQSKVNSKLQETPGEDRSTIVCLSVLHQPGAGGSTCARQVLWDCRKRYRCAVVKNTGIPTVRDIVHVRRYPHLQKATNTPPVIILMDNIDDEETDKFLSELQDATEDEPGLACLVLRCKRTSEPDEMAMNHGPDSVIVRHKLTLEEKSWFTWKYEQHLKGKCDLEKNPENLIGFMLMKEACSKVYIDRIVSNILPDVFQQERRLLKFLAVINQFTDSFDIPVSCCDEFMGNTNGIPFKHGSRSSSHSLPWEKQLSSAIHLVLKETTIDTKIYGYTKVIKLVHKNLAKEFANELVEKAGESVGTVIQEFIFQSHILDTTAYLKTYMRTNVQQLLTRREIVQTNSGGVQKREFSPVIIHLLAEEKDKAFFILHDASKKFQSAPLAQLLARIYLKDKEYDDATYFSELAIEYNPKNSYFLDTRGRIIITQIMGYFNPSEEVQPSLTDINLEQCKDLLELLKKGKDVFTSCQIISGTEESECQNLAGYYGMTRLVFSFLDVLMHRVSPFRHSKTILSQYLLTNEPIQDIQHIWQVERENLQGLSKLVYDALEYISDMLTYVKDDAFHSQNRSLPECYKDAKYWFGLSQEIRPPRSGQSSAELIQEWNRHQVRSIAEPTLNGIFKMVERNEIQELKRLKTQLCHNDPKNAFDLKILVCINLALSSRTGENVTQEEIRQEVRNLRKLYPNSLYGSFFHMLLLWPRNDFKPNPAKRESTLQAVIDVKKTWSEISKNIGKKQDRCFDEFPSHRTQQTKASTYFFLGKGDGLAAFVHISKLNISHASQLAWKKHDFWESHGVKKQLLRLHGKFKDRNFLRYWTPAGENIHIRMSSCLPSQPSQVDASFFLGFSFAEPVAYDVSEVDKEHERSQDLSSRCHIENEQYPRMGERSLSQEPVRHGGATAFESSGSRHFTVQENEVSILNIRMIKLGTAVILKFCYWLFSLYCRQIQMNDNSNDNFLFYHLNIIVLKRRNSL